MKVETGTLQPGLDALATLPGIASLQGLPSRHRSGLNTDHVLVSIIRAKVGHTLGLLDPRVPDHDIGQCLPCDREHSLVIGGGDDDRLLRVKVLVNTIDLLCDDQGIRGLGVSGRVADLVDVGLGLEVLDANIGDVLLKLVATNARQKSREPYRNSQVGVHQDLEVEVLLALVRDIQRGRQSILRQGDTVDESELIRPSLLEVLAQHVMVETEIQLNGEITLSRV